MRNYEYPDVDANTTPATFVLDPADNRRLAGLCGQYDQNLKQIEEYFNVEISHRGNVFSVKGATKPVHDVERVLRKLYDDTAQSAELEASRVHMVLTEAASGEAPSGDAAEDFVVRTRKAVIRGQNSRQRLYMRNIVEHDISFGVGPAGTGKTYLAVACAAQALINDRVTRIVLVRPAVEAGERLGFLPGDIGQKVDPYLRPLYDALYEMFGFDRVGKLLERSVIELAPLAYMRGRTLNDSFVILDEAQNTTVEQMKMFLTRIGFDSKAVITGDVTQIDLPRGTPSGLVHALNILDGIKGISTTRFKPQDVVRHPLVQKIVEAYEADVLSKEQGG